VDHYRVFEHPLVNMRWTRTQCLSYLKSKGFDVVHSSSCFYCPFHSMKSWKDLYRDHPEYWQKAKDLENKARYLKERDGVLCGMKEGAPTLSSKGHTLEEIEAMIHEEGDEDDVLSFFSEECAGVCGV
jgi:hypothetical protein